MRDYARNAKWVVINIRAVQKPWEDNSTQEKHNERCKIALAIHGMSIN